MPRDTLDCHDWREGRATGILWVEKPGMRLHSSQYTGQPAPPQPGTVSTQILRAMKLRGSTLQVESLTEWAAVGTPGSPTPMTSMSEWDKDGGQGSRREAKVKNNLREVRK